MSGRELASRGLALHDAVHERAGGHCGDVPALGGPGGGGSSPVYERLAVAQTPDVLGLLQQLPGSCGEDGPRPVACAGGREMIDLLRGRDGQMTTVVRRDGRRLQVLGMARGDDWPEAEAHVTTDCSPGLLV